MRKALTLTSMLSACIATEPIDTSGDGFASGDPKVPLAGDRVGLCPPPPPYGTRVGDVLPDVTLAGCDGVPHSLFDLCERDAAHIFLYTGW